MLSRKVLVPLVVAFGALDMSGGGWSRASAAEQQANWLWVDRDGFCPADCDNTIYKCPCFTLPPPRP